MEGLVAESDYFRWCLVLSHKQKRESDLPQVLWGVGCREEIILVAYSVFVSQKKQKSVPKYCGNTSYSLPGLYGDGVGWSRSDYSRACCVFFSQRETRLHPQVDNSKTIAM